MIVAYCEEGWEIITQRAHGLLAGQICARWKISDQQGRWVETLMATTEHDDVFNEFDQEELITQQGGPINFKMTSFDEEASEKLLDMALTKSRFIALLLSRHIQFTHGKDPKAKKFMKQLKQKESTWIGEAKSSKKEVNRAYELVEFCDAFSLLICQKQIPPEERKMEISKGPNGKSYSFFEQHGQLIVTPWPFETDQFEITYEIRTVKQLKFSSNETFRSLLRQAPVSLKQLKIVRA